MTHPHVQARKYAKFLRENKYPDGKTLTEFSRGMYIGYLKCMSDNAELWKSTQNGELVKGKCGDYSQRTYTHTELASLFKNSNSFDGSDIE